jgi:hypothetical protein
MSVKTQLEATPIFSDAVLKLSEGESPTAVAQWVQSEGYLLSSKENTVARALSAIQKKAVKVLSVPKGDRSAERILEISKIDEIAKLQLARVKILSAVEERAGMTMKETGREISLYAELQSSLFDKKAKLGIYDGVTLGLSDGSTTNNITQINTVVMPEHLQDVLDDPAKRRKILQMVDKAVGSASDKKDDTLDISYEVSEGEINGDESKYTISEEDSNGKEEA